MRSGTLRGCVLYHYAFSVLSILRDDSLQYSYLVNLMTNQHYLQDAIARLPGLSQEERAFSTL
jgi:hypothetical protein